MKLKEYIKPAIEIVPVEIESEILAASGGGVSDGDGLGDEYNLGDITYSKHHNNVWDIDEDED